MFVVPGTGVLCLMDLTLNSGTSTRSGSVPLFMPYRADPGFVIADSAIAPTVLLLPSSITAATVTDAEGCGVDGLFRAIVTSQAVPAAIPPDAANSTS